MENKQATISFRCTNKQKEFIESKAKRKGLSIGDYLINSALKKRTNPYKTAKDKDRVQMMIDITECINRIERYCNISNPTLEAELKNIKRIGEKSWELL